MKMMAEFRKYTISNLDKIMKKIKSIAHYCREKSIEQKVQSILSDVQLLKDDVLLLLNQNYYLNLKVQGKQAFIRQLEEKYYQKQENAHLELSMLKLKYEKSHEELHFLKFMKSDPEIISKIDFQKKYHHGEDEEINRKQCIQIKANQLQERAKIRNLEQIKFQTIKKPQLRISQNDSQQTKETHQKYFKEDFKPNCKKIQFDVNIEKLNGVITEQLSNWSQKKQEQYVQTQIFEEDIKNKKKRSRSSNLYQKKEDKHEKSQKNILYVNGKKKKSEELARLVEQQFKIPQIKEKYFSTDLL